MFNSPPDLQKLGPRTSFMRPFQQPQAIKNKQTVQIGLVEHEKQP